MQDTIKPSEKEQTGNVLNSQQNCVIHIILHLLCAVKPKIFEEGLFC